MQARNVVRFRPHRWLQYDVRGRWEDSTPYSPHRSVEALLSCFTQVQTAIVGGISCRPVLADLCLADLWLSVAYYSSYARSIGPESATIDATAALLHHALGPVAEVRKSLGTLIDFRGAPMLVHL